MKKRIDSLLVDKGLIQSRERAQTEIMAGNIFVNGQRVDKPGEKYDEEIEIEVRGKAVPYVSRGGLKLEKALSVFSIDLKDKVCIDVGASTGGFTDCMLKNGAAKVYSIDVGYGQLAWELRQDPRVICMDRTNIRYVEPKHIGESVDFCSIDVSFISLTLVLPPVLKILKDDGKIVCLIKPQFEAGREKVGKKGVVRDIAVHQEVVNKILDWASAHNLSIYGLDFSPVKGPEGNIEYLAYFCKGETYNEKQIFNVENIINDSHNLLK
ncbi:MAG: TlyA family RNA methyltransferase [Ignavibacteriales bacterium]